MCFYTLKLLGGECLQNYDYHGDYVYYYFCEKKENTE